MGIFVVAYAHGAVAQGARQAAPVTRRGRAEPLGDARDVGEQCAVRAVEVELGLVGHEQPLIRAECGRDRKHREGELTGGRRAEGDDEVGSVDQGRGDRCHPVCLKDPSADL